MSVTNKPFIQAVMGASGSGKSHYIKNTLNKQKPARLIIIDPRLEYGEHATLVSDLKGLWSAVFDENGKARARFNIRIKLTGDRKPKERAFSSICMLCMIIGKVFLVIEELHFVTQPSNSPEGWSEATLTGRHEGLKIIGASQRPANVDKDFFSNATLVRCGRLNYAGDAKTMADVLSVDKKEINDLPEWKGIQRDMQTGKTTRF